MGNPNILEQIAGGTAVSGDITESLRQQFPGINPQKIGQRLHKSAEYVKSPHKAIMDFVSPFLKDVNVGTAKLLVATYRQREKTKGGIIMTDNYLAEDMYQGITGLVLKAGPLAFEDSGKVLFGGFKAKPGDWVVYKPEEGRATELRGLHCRLISDVCIDAVVDDPELLW